MKRGDTFLHRHWLDENDQTKPMQCVVTRVANGIVWWKSVDGGNSYYFDLSEKDRYVGAALVANERK